MSIHQPVVGLVLALSLCASACSVQSAVPAVPVGSPSPTTGDPIVAPSPTPRPEIEAHWTADFSLELDDTWSLRECEGDAPDICVERDGEIVGNLELSEYPLDEAEKEQAPADVARTRAQGFLDFFSGDRAEGCPDFQFVADPVDLTMVGGQPGARTGFRLLDATGRTVERVTTHYAVHDGALFLVNTDAYALDGGCLDQSEVDLQFTPDVLQGFEPYVDRLVSATTLPAPSLKPDPEEPK